MGQRVSLSEWLRHAKKAWHGVRLNQPDWGDFSHSLAFGAELSQEGLRFHLILNAYWEPLDFELPVCDHGEGWHRWIDTALAPPNEIVEWERRLRFLGAPTMSGRAR